MRREINTIALALFIVLYAVYLFTYSGWLHIIDEVSLFSVTESLAKRGAFDTNQIAWSQWALPPTDRLGTFGLGGDVFSKKGLAPSLLAVPLYWLGILLPGVGNLQGAMLLNPILTAATAALLFLWTVRLGYAKWTGLILALLFGLGTMAWPYAKTFLGEPLSALALLLSIYYLSSKTRGFLSSLLAGFFLGLATATVALNLALAPLFVVYCLFKEQPNEGRGKDLVVFLLSLGLWCLGIGLYNLARFGNPLETGYHFAQGEGFSTPLGLGLYGLLFSPYKGLFLYAPILLISFTSTPLFLRRYRAEGLLILTTSLIYLYLYARWWMWWGGGAFWGPRFLVPLLPLLVLTLAPMVERALRQGDLWLKVGLWLLGFLSFAIQILAISVNYATWEMNLRLDFPAPEKPPVPHGPPWMSLPTLSPLLGQVHFFGRWNSDLAWLRPEAIEWPALAAGLFFLLLASSYLLVVLRWGESSMARNLGRLSSIVMILVTGFALSRYYHPLGGDPDPGYAASLAYIDAHHQSNDAILTITPYHYQIPMNRYQGRLPIYGFALDEPPLEEGAIPLLESILSRHWRLWLVTAGIPSAHASSGIEKWLAQKAYKASDRWVDDFRLNLYATPSGMGEVQEAVFHFGSAIELIGWYLDEELRDQVLCVSLFWRAQTSPEGDYKVFVHLVDDQGQLVAQRDAMPQDGYRPTSAWGEGERIEDRYGVLIPEDIPAGEYSLLVGLYDAITGARLEVRGDDGQVLGDSLSLTKVRLP